jgi:hypothetical protein
MRASPWCGRFDGVVIDGRTATEQPYNEYAYGHMCNHGTPNVMPVAYDFPVSAAVLLGWERGTLL